MKVEFETNKMLTKRSAIFINRLLCITKYYIILLEYDIFDILIKLGRLYHTLALLYSFNAILEYFSLDFNGNFYFFRLIFMLMLHYACAIFILVVQEGHFFLIIDAG